MKTIRTLLVTLLLAGCGVETAGTAATAAAMKKQEVEQAQAAQARVQRDVDALNQQIAQRAAQAEEAGK